MDPFTHLPAPPDHHHAAAPPPPFSGNSAHPPYPEMIMAAIAALDDKDGSSRQAIAKYIERHFSNLPPTHPNLLTHHLKRMKIEGHLIMIKHSYALPPPRSVPFQPPMDNHFTDYSITAPENNNNSFVGSPKRKPGRPPKPRQDFGFPVPAEPYQPQFEQDFQTQGEHGSGSGSGNYAQPQIFASLGLADDGVTEPPPPVENAVAVVSPKRGRGRPPKSASASGNGNGNGNVSASGGTTGSVDGLGSGTGTGTEGKRKRGRPKSLAITRVNGGVRKRGRPKRIGGIVTVPLSGNVASPRGRPRKAASGKEVASGGVESGSVLRSRGRGRPPKNNFRNLVGSQRKVGTGTAVIVTDPHQLVAYQELKLKYEQLQSKVKEVAGVVRPYINPDYEAFGALQELETLVGTSAIVESQKQQSTYV